jgi:hypothetical protein
MKRLIRLPISIVKTILSIAALPIGAVIMLSVIIAYTSPKALLAKKKEDTATI